MTTKELLIASQLWAKKTSLDHQLLDDGFMALSVPEKQAIATSIINRDGKAFELIDAKLNDLYTPSTETEIDGFIALNESTMQIIDNLIKFLRANHAN